MTLTQAINKRNTLRSNGVKCMLRVVSTDVWSVVLAGVDY